MNNRIVYFDGLRGIGILSVILFHAYSRWGEIESFKQSEFLSNLFSYGWLGVNLYFCISGYLIYMTLIKSENFLMYSFARLLRLGPAMFLVSIIIFLSAFYIPERPLGIPNIKDFLPGITFLGPGLVNEIFNIDAKSLDGAFWTLYVEVRFYIISGILYFFLKDKNLYGLFIMFILYFVLLLLFKLNINNIFFLTIEKYLLYFSAQHYGWFLIGIFFYKYIQSSDIKNLFIIILLSLMIFLIDFFWGVIGYGKIIGSIIVILIFIAPVFIYKIRLFLSSRILLFLGFVSYPLYLIHQNIVTGLSIKLYNIYPNIPSFMLPIPFLFLVIFISYFIFKLEVKIKNKIINLVPFKVCGIKIIKKNQ